MKGIQPHRRWFALVATAVLGAAMLFGTTGTAVAATCDPQSGFFFCGEDFAAVEDVEFNGKIGTEQFCTSGDYVVDWGDGSPTTGATGVCSDPREPSAARRYSAPTPMRRPERTPSR